MRKWIALCAAALLFLASCIPVIAEDGIGNAEGTVGKVTTVKGPLRMRSKPGSGGRVIAEIPNGSCLLIREEGDDWCLCDWQGKTGYCKTDCLTMLRDADVSLLEYRVLRRGDSGGDVLALKARLQELGYIRPGSQLTNVYNDTLVERVVLFQRETGMTEDGIATQEMQAYLFSERAPACTQKLPRIRSQTKTGDISELHRDICGCCMGEGCECCGYTGWIEY